ncbi:MAG TPA: hypothetical protein VEQ37_03480 [Actinomycetota bacterium]|nr:hypothetical protein [Actinomycetota bacterium]
MTTAEEMRETALRLARDRRQLDDAVAELVQRSGGRRVAVVLARRDLMQRIDEDPADADAARALELVEVTLDRGNWA